MQQTKVDPVLADLLKRASTSRDPLQVVLILKPEGGEASSAAARTEEVAGDLLQRVAKETGEEPLRFNVFRNLSSLAVEATPNFIRRLVEQDEVVSAIANQQPSSSMGSQTETPVPKATKRPAVTSSKVPAPAKRSKAIKKR